MISLRLEECIKQHRFKELFIDDLGWDNFNSIQELDIGDQHIRLESFAEKRGLRVFCCSLQGKVLLFLLRNSYQDVLKHRSSRLRVYFSRNQHV